MSRWLIVLVLLTRPAGASAQVGGVDGEWVFGPRVGATITLVDGYRGAKFTEREVYVDAAIGVVTGYRFRRQPSQLGVGFETGAFFVRRGIGGIDQDAVYRETWTSVEVPVLLTILAPVNTSARPRISLGPYFNFPVADDELELEPAYLAVQGGLGLDIVAGPGFVTLDVAYQRQINAYSGEDNVYQGIMTYLGLLF